MKISEINQQAGKKNLEKFRDWEFSVAKKEQISNHLANFLKNGEVWNPRRRSCPALVFCGNYWNFLSSKEEEKKKKPRPSKYSKERMIYNRRKVAKKNVKEESKRSIENPEDML